MTLLPPSSCQANVRDSADVSVEGDALHVLVVDDEPAIRTVACRALRRVGYEVSSVADGEEAIERCLAESKVGLILVDQSMPGMAGEEFVRRIAEMRPGIPIVMMSGYAGATVLLPEVSEHIGAFLHKPFTLAQLTAAIDQALG